MNSLLQRLCVLPAALLVVSAVHAGDLDFDQHVRDLRPRVPAGFSLIVQPPFVVLGDSPEAAVRRFASGTVDWAVQKLRQDYFQNDPDAIIDIWLFKDKDSYERNTQKLFGESPISPFGYYSPAHGALIMNIGTGGGTLVHEIVHPFMRANFPDCPDWFNEGLASLYEQSGERDGHIVGRTNWRLSGLQEAIRDHSLPSFRDLTSTSGVAFYERNKGANYAQARYLCYYLQEKGLIVKFYKSFLASHKDDPTGYKTLQTVLAESDMPAFQKRWESFVLDLHFP